MVCLLPSTWAFAIGRFFGWLWYFVLPVRRGTAKANVQRALGGELSPPEQRRVVRRCFTHLALYGVETLRAPLMTSELSHELVERRGFELIDAALARGHGMIAFMAHIGNIDLIGYSQAARGLPISVVVKPIGWGAAQRFVTLVRERTGLKLISAKRSKDVIRAALLRNEIVPLIIDQHMAPHRGIVCEFFGQLASTSPAVARFALETGAPVHPAIIVRQGLSPHHVATIEPQFAIETPYADPDANIRHNTERINRHIEGWVRQYPEQWLWLHKRWKVQDSPQGWSIPPHLQHLVSRKGTT